jgi:hypothetical protein
MNTMNSNTRIAATRYSLGTCFFLRNISVDILHKRDTVDDDDDNNNKNNITPYELTLMFNLAIFKIFCPNCVIFHTLLRYSTLVIF